MMIILASDTSTSSGSVALRDPNGVLHREDLEGSKPHSETLLPAVENVLSRAGLKRGDIKAIAVGTGPGAFTGLRVGLATFKGWAAASALPLIPVVSMDAVAWPLLEEGFAAVVLSDARKGEVYAAYYPLPGKGSLPERSDEISLIPHSEVPEYIRSLKDPDARLVGTAVPFLVRAGYQFEGAAPVEGPGAPDALNILVLAEMLYSQGRAVAPGDLVPTYVRSPDARKPSPGTVITGAGIDGKCSER